MSGFVFMTSEEFGFTCDRLLTSNKVDSITIKCEPMVSRRSGHCPRCWTSLTGCGALRGAEIFKSPLLSLIIQCLLSIRLLFCWLNHTQISAELYTLIKCTQYCQILYLIHDIFNFALVLQISVFTHSHSWQQHLIYSEWHTYSTYNMAPVKPLISIIKQPIFQGRQTHSRITRHVKQLLRNKDTRVLRG